MKGHGVSDSQGIISELKYGSVNAERSYLKLYKPVSEKILLVTGCPVNLFFFLCEEASLTNQIGTDQGFIDKFRAFVSDSTDGKLTYSVQMVKHSLKQLRDIELLLPVNRGRYLINPFYFWKSDQENERISSIKYVMERMNYKPA